MTLVPAVWPFVLLALGSFRLTRLAAWDTFPPVERLRDRLVRPWVQPICSFCKVERPDYEQRPDGGWTGRDRCPNCRSDEPAIFLEHYRRPLIGELLSCPFCLGWWVSLAVYLSWVGAPRVTLIACAPLALAAIVGLVAKNLDA